MGKLIFEPAIGTTATMLVAAVAIAALAWWISRASREEEDPAASQRRKLVYLRLLGLFLLLLGLLRPAYVRTDRLPTAATLAVLLDGSRSMTLKADSERSRWEVERSTWQALAPAIQDAGELIEPRIYAYDAELRALALNQMDEWLSAEPNGISTDVAGALAGALRESSGRPLAAVVLIGDGTQTAANDGPAAAATARSLAALDVPLWTIPIGPRLSAGQTRDLAMQDMADQYKVFTKNVFQVSATLQARGFSGRNLPVELELVDGTGKRRSLAKRDVTPNQADQALPIRMDVTAPEPGSYRLELTAKLQEGEILSDNNRIVAFLDVKEGGGRVLYLDGQLSVEQKFFRRSINESDDLQLAFRWIEGGADGNWTTADLRAELTGDRYDVIVIGDLPAAALGTAQMEAIVESVSRGKALLMIGGYRSFDAGGYGDSPLAKILPVNMLRNVPASAASDPRFELPGPLRPQAPEAHPITQLSETGDSAALWRRLPPIGGGTRLGAPKAVPGVAVPLIDENKQPLLVVGEFGKGRVAALGLDSTWQWWMKGQSSTHRRFWRQMMLWLLARDARQPGQVWVEIDRRRWSEDETVDFRAGLDDPAAERLELIAELFPQQGTPIPLQTTAGLTGDARTVVGQIHDVPPGFYLLRVSTAAPNTRPAEIAVHIATADRELSRPAADIAQMEQLAELTSSSGGKAYEPDDLEELKQKLQSLRQRAAVPIVRRYRLGDGPISGSVLLLLLLGILSTEWALRRRWQLP